VKYRKPKYKYFQYAIQHEKEVPDKKIEALRKEFQRNFDSLDKKVNNIIELLQNQVATKSN
jgi:hypothetical protein